VGTDGAGFPEPFWLSLLTVVAGGAAGAAAANRLAGPGRRGDGGWAAGALPTLVVGSTAAVVALTLNPPGHAWWSLAATAAAAGLGAEAVVLGAAGIRAGPIEAAGAPSPAASRGAGERDGRTERAGVEPARLEADFDGERR
jgi:hypothetical protein